VTSSLFPLLARNDLAVAAHRKLSTVPGVVSALASPVGSAPVGVWLFVRKLQAVVEGTGKAAAVLREEGAWTRPNQHNTARFPRLSLEIYADCSRESLNGPPLRDDAESRARMVWEHFQTVLHRVDGFSEVWGSASGDPGLRVWGSQLMSLPDVYEVSDWPEGVRLQCHYGLNTG